MISDQAFFNRLIEYEQAIVPANCLLIAGIDEAGRGPLAGPVLAAAVIMPQNMFIDGIYDSKALSPQQRERLFNKIVSLAIDIGIGIVDSNVIDEINILNASIQAMQAAYENLIVKPDCLLIDAISLPEQKGIIQIPIIKGDQKCYSIAASSIVAKVVRDRLMNRIHRRFPEYNFYKNKGYGTREHIMTIERIGPCPEHRRSFKRVREHVESKIRVRSEG